MINSNMKLDQILLSFLNRESEIAKKFSREIRSNHLLFLQARQSSHPHPFTIVSLVSFIILLIDAFV